MKLICMAPKLGAPGVPLNSGPTVGVNTSDRNSTETDAALEKLSSSKSDILRDAERPSVNGSKLHGRNGNDGQQDIGCQLETDVGSLHLTAPGTSRDGKAESISEDEGSIDSVGRAEQEERFKK